MEPNDEGGGGGFDTRSQLYRVFINVITMMRHRGYILAPDATAMTESEFFRVFPNRDAMTLSLIHREIRGQCIRVFFCDPCGKATMGKQMIERVLERVDQGRTNVLLVLPGSTELTPQAKKVVEAMSSDSTSFVECMTELELSACPPFDQKYGLGGQWTVVVVAPRAPVASFAKISVNDPISRYLGARVGDVLACTRSSETAGFYTQYRVVIHHP
jgi:hypothetical protein